MRKGIFDIYFVDIFRLFRKKWKTIGITTLVFTVLGLVVALGTPAEYTSQVKIVPEGLRSSAGNISDLAAIAGVDVNMTNRSDAISPMVYPDVISSVPFLVHLSKVKVPVNQTNKTLYDYMTQDVKAPLLLMIAGLPLQAVAAVRSLLPSDSDTLKKLNQTIQAYNLTEIQEQTLLGINQRITIDVDKKKRILTVSVSMQDPKVCAVVADSVVSFLNDFIIQYRTEKAKRDYQFTAGLVEKAKQDYYTAQARYAHYSDANNNEIKNSVTIERDRLFSEQQLAFSVYSNLAQQLETAKIRVQEQTPCISMIEPARIPVYKSNLSKLTLLGISVLLGVFVSLISVFFSNYKSLVKTPIQSE